VIAIALINNPGVLIADEPTTALDVTIQAQILTLMKKLQAEIESSIIFITHDLGVVAGMADRVAVMYAGQIIEIGTVDEIFNFPQHPYTWGLLNSMPTTETERGELEAIPGTPPDLLNPPVGDAFAARNKFALAIDREQKPPFFKLSETHFAATWLLDERAPEVTPPVEIQKRWAKFKENHPEADRSQAHAVDDAAVIGMEVD
jgi:oligopeptide transport system ATP-binding protein